MPTKKLVTRYEQDLRLFPDLWQKVGLVVALVGLLSFPFVASEYWLGVGNETLIMIVGAIAMMILTGFAGQVSLGHAAFLAVGAYTVSILGSIYGVPFWLAIPVAGVLAALVGLAVGPFALRLEGLYLAIVTVGLLFLVQHGIKNGVEEVYDTQSFTASMHGWFVEPGAERSGLGSFFQDSSFFGFVLDFKQKLYLLFLLLAGIALWVGRNLANSTTGRAMMAVRDRDTIAAVIGVNPARTKFIAFGLSSFFAGVAGAMFAYKNTTLYLDAGTGEPFSLGMSVSFLAMVVLGGVGTMFGAVWGALAFTVLFPLAEHLGGMLPFPATVSSENQAALIFFPVLCIFLVFEPLGLFGIWLRIKRYFMAWPFRY
jgi:branched-chain amino acid transport system permease protein